MSGTAEEVPPTAPVVADDTVIAAQVECDDAVDIPSTLQDDDDASSIADTSPRDPLSRTCIFDRLRNPTLKRAHDAASSLTAAVAASGKITTAALYTSTSFSTNFDFKSQNLLHAQCETANAFHKALQSHFRLSAGIASWVDDDAAEQVTALMAAYPWAHGDVAPSREIKPAADDDAASKSRLRKKKKRALRMASMRPKSKLDKRYRQIHAATQILGSSPHDLYGTGEENDQSESAAPDKCISLADRLGRPWHSDPFIRFHQDDSSIQRGTYHGPKGEAGPVRISFVKPISLHPRQRGGAAPPVSAQEDPPAEPEKKEDAQVNNGEEGAEPDQEAADDDAAANADSAPETTSQETPPQEQPIVDESLERQLSDVLTRGRKNIKKTEFMFELKKLLPPITQTRSRSTIIREMNLDPQNSGVAASPNVVELRKKLRKQRGSLQQPFRVEKVAGDPFSGLSVSSTRLADGALAGNVRSGGVRRHRPGALAPPLLQKEFSRNSVPADPPRLSEFEKAAALPQITTSRLLK